MPDAGSPHTHPDDYTKLGLDFERDNAAVQKERRPSHNPEHDKAIERQVCQRLEANQFVGQRRIRVISVNGEVMLEGIADNRFERERAEQLTREVPDVRSVDNRIHVQVREDATGGPVLTARDPQPGEPSAPRS